MRVRIKKQTPGPFFKSGRLSDERFPSILYDISINVTKRKTIHAYHS